MICRYALPILLLAANIMPSVSAAQTAVEAVRPFDQATWPDLKRKVVLPNGETIAYVALGNESAPPLILIHGFTDNSRSWSLAAPYLLARHRLIIPDLRGHGASAAPECCYALADLAYDIRLLMDSLAIKRADLAGHSLGSMVAQTFAQAYPDRAGRVVLISSALSASEIFRPGSWLWTNIHRLRAPIDPNSKFMIGWYANPHPVDQAFLAAERRESAAVPVHVWTSVDEELAKSNFGALSTLIGNPVLILCGKSDSLFGGADQAALRAALPRARFVVFDTGHNVMWEQPAKVAEEIDRFLAADGEGGKSR